MTHRRAMHIVRVCAGQVGHKVGGETAHRPGTRWSSFHNFITTTADQMELWVERDGELRGICRTRSREEIKMAADFLLQFSEDARSLSDILKEILGIRT
jgi:hypothetical protein